MKEYKLLDMLENIDPAYIEVASVPEAKKSNWLVRSGIAAACFVLIFSLSVGIYAYAKETKEYNTAIEFFNEYALPTEGLSRSEIKKVYQDITTESFSYSKTAEVITRSLSSEQIEGYEILQKNPSPEDVEKLWNYKNSDNDNVQNEDQKKKHYKYWSDYTTDTREFVKSHFEKYDGEKLLWNVSISDFYVTGYKEISDGVIVYGKTPGFSTGEDSYAWMTKYDIDGNIIWKVRIENGFSVEYISGVFEEKDGGYTIFTRGDHSYFCLSRYTSDGKRVHFKKTDIDDNSFSNITRFGDGYLALFCNKLVEEKIVKVDRDGNITDSFCYDSEDSYYYVNDMIEFDGKIYLSTYVVPKMPPELEGILAKTELANVTYYLWKNNITEISEEELTPMLRDNYTAMLLVCDPDVGTPQEFYSVKGSIGGALTTDASGNLLWEVESIATSYYSPYTSSYTFGGTCYLYRYVFDDTGSLLRQEETGEITELRR